MKALSLFRRPCMLRAFTTVQKEAKMLRKKGVEVEAPVVVGEVQDDLDLGKRA